jgi:hypothetical protein
MAKMSNNKYPADKTGTKYSEFRNTKRIAPGKTRIEKSSKQSGASEQPTDKTA